MTGVLKTWEQLVAELDEVACAGLAKHLSTVLDDPQARDKIETQLVQVPQLLEQERPFRHPLPGEADPSDDEPVPMATVEQHKAEVWERYPTPDEARELVAQRFKQEALDTPEDALDEALGELEAALEDTHDLDELAADTGLDREVLRRLVPKLQDDDRSDHAGPAILRERTDDAPDPLPSLIDGDVAMVGSLPGGLRCGEHMIVRCQSCYEKWNADDGYAGFPHPYARTSQPVGCETPDCEACKLIYVPTRAAAAAIRVQRFLERTDQEIVLRHVVVSPPWDTLDELAQENFGPVDRDTIGTIETRVAKLVEKKGAVAQILVRHPWRGWWDQRPWRESWHFHVLAAFPKDGVPDSVTPNNWSPEFVPGGQTCCQHTDAFKPNVEDGHAGPCCEGDCEDPSCPHHRIAQARSEVRSLAGKLGAAKRTGQVARARRFRDRLEHAKAELAAAKQAACDEGYLFHVTEHADGTPRTVSTEPYRLKGGACEGLEVPEGVLALLQYELDHAGSVRDTQGRTKLHTIKWYGDWSYRNLELDHEDKHAVQQLKEGLDQAECPNCGEPGLLPVHDAKEHRDALVLLSDRDLRIQRLKQIELAREMGWLPSPTREASSATSGSHDSDPGSVKV